MKKSLQTITEMEIAIFVLAATAIALILMIGHAVWKDVVNQPQQNSQTDEPLNVAICTETRILSPRPPLEFAGRSRRELFLREQRTLPKARFVRSISFFARRGWIDDKNQ